MRYTLAMVLALAALGCTKPPPAPTTADVSRVEARFPGLTLAELQSGRDLYRARCGSCHVLYHPATHGATDWPRLLGEMAERAKLSGPERGRVERYLVAMASRATPATATAAR